MVLLAHISMAEILARVGCDHRRACNSNAPRPGDPCASFSGSQRRATPVEAACSDGSVRIRGVLACGPRSPQSVCGSARLWTGPATREAEGRHTRILAQAI